MTATCGICACALKVCCNALVYRPWIQAAMPKPDILSDAPMLTNGTSDPSLFPQTTPQSVLGLPADMLSAI